MAFNTSQKPHWGANIESHTEVLPQNGSIATYATNVPMPEPPVRQLAFVNARLCAAQIGDLHRRSMRVLAHNLALGSGAELPLIYRHLPGFLANDDLKLAAGKGVLG